MSGLVSAALVTGAVMLGCLFGFTLGSAHSTAAYAHGYDAGVAHRDREVRDTNDALIASGLCVYSNLVCKGKSK